jgi:hypothetical protein
MRQHIGVGRAVSIRDIEIWWPASGIRQHFSNIAVDRTYHIREDSNTLHPIVLKTFEIGKTKIAVSAHQHQP